MNNHTKILLSFLAVAMLGIGIPAVAAQNNAAQYQYSNGIASISTDDLEIRVVGANQFPHFQWWSPTDESIDYNMMFVSLFEANDTDADGVFTQGLDTVVGPRFMLPTSGWEFSDFATDTDGENITAVHFNFTSTSEFDPRPGSNYGHLPNLSEFDVMIQIRVHLYMNNPGEVKFDVVIDGWQWTYEDSILVMQFTLTQRNHQDGSGEAAPGNFTKTGTQFNFNNAYMSYEEEALALEAQNTLQVKASYGDGVGQENGESIYLAFEYFGNDTMVYDPIIGIESADALPLSLDTTTLLIVGGIAVVVVVAIALKLKK